jgi:hypothetical protein
MYPARHTQDGDAESKTLVEKLRELPHNTHPLVEPEAALYIPAPQAVHAAMSPSHEVS